MKEYKIVAIPGDGIGPEITRCALGVLHEVAKRYDCKFEVEEKLMGGVAIDATGVPLPQETIDSCLKSDAVLLGAVGGPKWEVLPGKLRPEAGLLGIRGALGLYANLRPAKVWPSLINASPLKPEILGDGMDVLVVRELTGGIYFGEKGRYTNDKGFLTAFDTETYDVSEITRIGHVAFKAARERKGIVTSVDKDNVLESGRLWREVMAGVAKEYPDVKFNNMYTDNAAMQLVRNPKQFDVIVTSNMFGDILSDEASQITGSIGMLPSASLGDGTLGLYEPIHGSAPDILGQDKANPLATILSVAMMLRYSFNMPAAAKDIETAVGQILAEGYRTADLALGSDSVASKLVGCKEMGRLVKERVKAL